MTFENNILSGAKLIQHIKPVWCYVYIGVIDGIIQYIGKGSKARWEHLNSGRSQIPAVKAASVAGLVFDVYILCDGLTHKEAFNLEKSAIIALKPVMNKEHNNILIYEKY